LTLALGACAGSDGEEGKEATKTTKATATSDVTVKDFVFAPNSITVKKGTTVTWKFLDGDTNTPHNVASRGTPRFRSSATKQTGTHKVTFRKRGTYRYVCTIHPNMKGRIVVR
jgi:plastocyanin